MIIMAYYWGANGAIFSQYIYETLGVLFLLSLNYRILFWGEKNLKVISNEERWKFKKFALSMKANDIISTVMTLIDVFMIGLVFKNEDLIASYKVATIIPSAITFTSNSFMVYAMPLFVQNNKNYRWVLSRTKHMLLMMVGLCGCIALCGILVANWILPLVFGIQYADVIECYIVLLINFVIVGGVQIPIANIMTTQKIIRYKMIVLSVCGFLNIVLDIIFIHEFGSIGAAIATTLISAISAFSYSLFFFRRMRLLIQEQVIGGHN